MQRANPCIDSPFFSVRIVDFEGSFHRNLKKYGSFIISMCLQGDCLIKIRSTQDGVILREGHTCLIPAEIADYDVIPIGKKTKLLDAFIDNRERSILSAASRFLHLATK
jgi:mannose-6-phosphate isomerase